MIELTAGRAMNKKKVLNRQDINFQYSNGCSSFILDKKLDSEFYNLKVSHFK